MEANIATLSIFRFLFLSVSLNTRAPLQLEPNPLHRWKNGGNWNSPEHTQTSLSIHACSAPEVSSGAVAGKGLLLLGGGCRCSWT